MNDHVICTSCGSQPEDLERCLACGKPGAGVEFFPIQYDRHALFLTPRGGDSMFAELSQNLTWVRAGTTPRMEYFISRVGKPYSYGKAEFARTYYPQPSTPMIDSLWAEVERIAGVKFEVCFLNRYLTQSDHLGWHSDNSPEMDDRRPIAIVSFGAERDILFRSLKAKLPLVVNGNDIETFGTPVPPTLRVTLHHGSLCLMAPGMQDTHQHRIPKSGKQCGERISMTFRGYVEPSTWCPPAGMDRGPLPEFKP